jgi:hypothetical protein
MKKVYITEPKVMLSGFPDSAILCYSLLEWEEGSLAIPHAPCSGDETRVSVSWGDDANVIRQLVLDNTVATISGITSNDVIFLGGLA